MGTNWIVIIWHALYVWFNYTPDQLVHVKSVKRSTWLHYNDVPNDSKYNICVWGGGGVGGGDDNTEMQTTSFLSCIYIYWQFYLQNRKLHLIGSLLTTPLLSRRLRLFLWPCSIISSMCPKDDALLQKSDNTRTVQSSLELPCTKKHTDTSKPSVLSVTVWTCCTFLRVWCLKLIHIQEVRRNTSPVQSNLELPCTKTHGHF